MIFDCGQCFRFNKNLEKNVWEGVAFGEYAAFSQDDKNIYTETSERRENAKLWEHFLALDCDYDEVQMSILSAFKCDDIIKRAMAVGDGIRILRQDFHETLISFIISQNNNIPRIMGIVERISRDFGEKIIAPDKREFYTFPTANALFSAGTDAIFERKTGFRAKYIFDAARREVENDTDGGKIIEMSSADALNELCKISGVGPKVANCVMLFGLDKTDAFPVDVWIKKVIAKYFPSGLETDKLGPYGGVAQQYLFYFERYMLDREKKEN